MKVYKPIRQIWKYTTSPLKKLSLFIKHRFGLLDVPKIIVYRGFGNEKYFFIGGQVVEDKRLSQPEIDDSIWENIKAMVLRYIGDDIPGVDVIASFKGTSKVSTTDKNGNFAFIFSLDEHKVEENGWVKVHFRLKEIPKDNKPIEAYGEALIIAVKPKFGVISDIDDTVLVSNATQMLKKFRLMFFKNALTRAPFKGVSAFYNSLIQGDNRQEFNPIFYVSSSEWNLYDLLEGFCNYHGIPKGPFLLRELNYPIWKIWKLGGRNHDHKLQKIEQIFNTFAEIPFILIGDSGQHDLYIYLEAAKKYHGKILVVYIREIKKRNLAEIQKLKTDYAQTGTEFLLVKDTYEAAVHASKYGYISEELLQKVLHDKIKDEILPTDIQYITPDFMNSENTK